MKKTLKFLLAFVLVFTLINCEVKIEPKQANAQTSEISDKYDHIVFKRRNGDALLKYKKYYVDDVEYHLYWGLESSVKVINHTKEKLEIEKLKLEIEKLKPAF